MIHPIYRYSRTIILFVLLLSSMLLPNDGKSQANWEYFVDSASAYTGQDLAEIPFTKELKGDNFNFSFLPHSVWFKMTVPSSPEKRYLFITNPTISTTEFYIQSGNKVIKTVLTGANMPIGTREFHFGKLFFEIPESDRDQVVFLRLQTNGSLLGAFLTLDSSNYLDVLTNDQVISFIVNGILISLTIIYLVIFLTLRERTYLFYFAYIVFVSLSISRINGSLALFPLFDTSFLFKYQAALEAATSVTAGIFGIHFLRLRLYKWLFRFFGLLVVLQLSWFFLSFINNQLAMQLVESVASVYILAIIPTAAFIYFKEKYTPAIYFLISWIFLFVGASIYIAANAGSITANNVFTQHGLELGVAIEMIFLSIGVSKRIDGIIKNSLKIKADNIAILSNQKERLEEMVNEKTAQLAEQNEQLQSSLDELRETQSRLLKSEKMASLGTLSAGIAHEINNPLNFISGSLQNLTIEMKDDKKVNEFIGFMEEGVNRISKIVKGLGALTSKDNKMATSCNVHEILDNCITISQLNHEEQVKVHKDYQANNVIVKGDPSSLHLAFTNILNNAFDSIAGEGEVWIKTWVANNQLKVSIEDTGIGIKKEVFNKIGDPFFTTKPPGKGVGLGLYLTYTIIGDHGGNIDFSSEEGKGSTFTIDLPKPLAS